MKGRTKIQSMVEVFTLGRLEMESLQTNMQNRRRYALGEITKDELVRKNNEQNLKLKAYRAADKKGDLTEFIATVHSAIK